VAAEGEQEHTFGALIPAQRAFLDHLHQTASTEDVDAILVVGGVFSLAVGSAVLHSGGLPN
jgi:hypothetical protein